MHLAAAVALLLALDPPAPAGLGSRVGPAAGHRALPPRADSVIAFRLHDQFGRVHDAADYRGRVVVLVGAGRGGRAAGTAWVEALRALQPDSAVPVVAVADLRGVPRLLRRVVRGRFPDDRRRAVLLDWDGALARRLGFEAERCTVVLVAPDGRSVTRTSHAEVDSTAARELLRHAARLAPSAAAAAPD